MEEEARDTAESMDNNYMAGVSDDVRACANYTITSQTTVPHGVLYKEVVINILLLCFSGAVIARGYRRCSSNCVCSLSPWPVGRISGCTDEFRFIVQGDHAINHYKEIYWTV